MPPLYPPPPLLLSQPPMGWVSLLSSIVVGSKLWRQMDTFGIITHVKLTRGTQFTISIIIHLIARRVEVVVVILMYIVVLKYVNSILLLHYYFSLTLAFLFNAIASTASFNTRVCSCPCVGFIVSFRIISTIFFVF